MTMFNINRVENDRLLLEEEQRRNDLLEKAVSSFAPRLTGKAGVRTIHLYSTNSSLRKTIREAFSGSRTILVEHCISTGRSRKGVNEIQHDGMMIPIPKTADLVVTKSNLNSHVELFAAQLRALPVVLPEGIPYIHQRLTFASALVLVGAEQRGK